MTFDGRSKVGDGSTLRPSFSIVGLFQMPTRVPWSPFDLSPANSLSGRFRLVIGQAVGQIGHSRIIALVSPWLAPKCHRSVGSRHLPQSWPKWPWEVMDESALRAHRSRWQSWFLWKPWDCLLQAGSPVRCAVKDGCLRLLQDQSLLC